MFDKFGRVSYSPHTKVAGFVELLEQGVLAGSRCKECGYRSFPPRADCPQCLSGDFELVEISGRGEVITYTEIKSAPLGFADVAPYTIGVIDLVDGGRLLAWFGESIERGDISIGMKVRVALQTIETEDGVKHSYSLEAPA